MTTLRLMFRIVCCTSLVTCSAKSTAAEWALCKVQNDSVLWRFANLAARSAAALWVKAQNSAATRVWLTSWCAATFVIWTLDWKLRLSRVSWMSLQRSAWLPLIAGGAFVVNMVTSRLTTDWQSDQIRSFLPQCFAYNSACCTAISSARNALCNRPGTGPAIKTWLWATSPDGCAWMMAHAAKRRSGVWGQRQLPSLKMSNHSSLAEKGAGVKWTCGREICRRVWFQVSQVELRKAHPCKVRLGGNSGRRDQNAGLQCCLSELKTGHSQKRWCRESCAPQNSQTVAPLSE